MPGDIRGVQIYVRGYAVPNKGCFGVISEEFSCMCLANWSSGVGFSKESAFCPAHCGDLTAI